MGADPAAHDLQPRDRGLELLGGDFIRHADALQVLLELAGRQAGGALDLADPLGDLAVGRSQADPLRVLNLQPFVDHLAQHLRRDALTQLRSVGLVGRADGEDHTLRQLEIGDRVVIHARHHPQALRRGEDRAEDDGERDEGAKDQRVH